MTPSDRDATGLLTRPEPIVQLVTPTGERRRTPSSTAGSPTSTPRRSGASTATWSLVRRIDTEAHRAAAPGPARPLGAAAGQEAAQVGTARALARRRLRLPELPRDRRGVRAAARSPPTSCARGAARRTPACNPYDINMATPQIIIGAQALHAVGYAMGIQRDGTDQVARRLLRRRRHEPGRRERGDGLRVDASARRSCSSARTTSGRSPSRSALQAKFPHRRPRAGLRHPEHARRRQRRARRASRRCAGRSTTPARGDGPTFIEAVTYRMGPHTTSDDPTRYRDKDEVERWRERDPLARVEALLRGSGGFDSDGFERDVAAEADRVGRRAARGHAWRSPTREPIDGLRPRLRRAAHRPRRASATSSRAYLDGVRRAACRRRRTMTQLTMAKAINEGLRRAMADDPKVVVMGEDIGKLGGVFRVTDGLLDEFGAQRVIDTPLAEAGIMGTAVGLAFRGYRPVVEIQFDGFVYPAFDQIVVPGREAALPHARQRDDADHDPHPVGRRSRRGRAPLRVARGVLRAHRRACASSRARTRRTRTSCCARRSRATTRWSSSSPSGRYHSKGEVDDSTSTSPTRRRWASRASCARARDVTLVTYGAQVQTALDAAIAAEDDGHLDRGHRPALALAGRLRARSRHPCARPAASSSRTRPAREGGRRRRARRERHRALLQLPRGRARARHRPRHPLPAREAREAPPARPRPHPRRRRPRAGPPELAERSGGVSGMIKEFPLPDLGEGLTEAEIVAWRVAVGDTVDAQPDHRRGRDGQGRRRAAVAVRRRRSPRCTPPRARRSTSARR